jgi:hypothetical protein
MPTDNENEYAEFDDSMLNHLYRAANPIFGVIVAIIPVFTVAEPACS